MKGLYVHIPFCVRKCSYCDFYSLPAQTDSIKSYIQALMLEAGAYSGTTFDTIYLGGGTPSLLGADNLTRLIDSLRRTFDLSELVEATTEVNPESASIRFLEAARASGINRISIGVQSLSEPELQKVGRVHSAAQAVEAVDRAGKLGFRSVSADLIIGLPGQTWDTLRTSMDILIRLGVDHLSLYCLSLEHGTPLALHPPADLPSDDMQADLFEKASLLLDRRGFGHYEISNFAREGHECLHNLNYWRGGEYLGLGPAAASHLNGRRFKNRADLSAYLKNPTHLAEEVEELNCRDKAAEEAMLRLRLLSEGLNTDELARRFGRENVGGLVGRLQKIARAGDLYFDGSSYKLTPAKVLTSNRILAEVLFD